MGKELVYVVFTVTEVKPGRDFLVYPNMRIDLPNFSSYLKGVQYVWGKDFFDNLESRRARRMGHVYAFRDKARKATTKALKAMWNNLSKGQLFHAVKIEKQLKRSRIYFFLGYVAFISLIALALAPILMWVV